MKTRLISAAILTLLAANFASAQGRPASPPVGTNLAVIDISEVFKNHIRFKQSMEFMKKDVEQFETYVRDQRKQLTKMAEKLDEFRSGSPDYRRQEEEIARISSDLQVQMQLKRKEFLEREARLYYNVYGEIVSAVSGFAQQNQISLVLRFTSDPIAEEDRGSILQGVNRAVVFQRNLNITSIVLEYLNGRVAPEVGRDPRSQIPVRPRR